jgi:hypothetical protein
VVSSTDFDEDVARFANLNVRFRAAIDRVLELDDEFGLGRGPELGFARRLFGAWDALKKPDARGTASRPNSVPWLRPLDKL